MLKSKILSAIADPRSSSSAILVAESAGSVRHVKFGVRDPINELWNILGYDLTCTGSVCRMSQTVKQYIVGHPHP